MKFSVPSHISSLKSYVPGKPPEELEREYGITDSVKLASNENPLGPSPKAMEAVAESLKNLHRYPEGGGFRLVEKLSALLKVAGEQIVLGNGSDDIIGMLTRAFLQPGDEVILPVPSFLMYEISAKSAGAACVEIPLRNLKIDLEGIRAAVTPKTRLMFICNPNNPTGDLIRHRELADFLSQVPSGCITVLDEAYYEFVRDPERPDSLRFLDGGSPVVILRTFSKAYGLAGLRIGYGITTPEIADCLNRVRMPFNTSLPAQTGACAALEDTEFLKRTVQTVHEGIDFLRRELEEMGVTVFPTQSNFMMADVGGDARAFFEAMLQEGVIVRAMTSYGFPEHIRVSAGTPAENRRFIDAFRRVMG